MEQEIRRYVRTDVRAGFSSDDEIVQVIGEVLDHDYREDAVRAVTPRIIAEERKLLAEEEQLWPSTTDCDRLDRAFACLEAAGIVARQNFSCCGNCGAGEIWGEIDAVASPGMRVRGYVFYHQQDTESAADGYGLCLSYGATTEGEQPALEVAHEIVATLKAHDLPTDWNGKCSTRIDVPLKWQRRQSPSHRRA